MYIEPIESKYHHDHNFTEEPVIMDDLILYQIGEIFLDNSVVIKPHIHADFFEISFITSGTGMFITNNKKQTVKKGDLFLSLPNEEHSIYSDSYDPLRYFYTAFSFNELSEFRKILYRDELLKLNPNDRIYRTTTIEFSNRFNELITSFENDSKYAHMKFLLLIKLLCIDVVEIFTKTGETIYNSPTISSDDNIYYNVTKYIDKNLLKINNLQEVAEALNHNYSYLSRIFKKKFGQTMYDYYSNQKLNLAKKLIEDGNMSLTKISNYLNYTSVYVFSRSFKNAFGVSPKAYKDSLKQKING